MSLAQKLVSNKFRPNIREKIKTWGITTGMTIFFYTGIRYMQGKEAENKQNFLQQLQTKNELERLKQRVGKLETELNQNKILKN